MTNLMCAQKLTDSSLIYRTGPKTKTSKTKKTKKQTNMLRRNGAEQETMESVRKKEGKSGRGKENGMRSDGRRQCTAGGSRGNAIR